MGIIHPQLSLRIRQENKEFLLSEILQEIIMSKPITLRTKKGGEIGHGRKKNNNLKKNKSDPIRYDKIKNHKISCDK